MDREDVSRCLHIPNVVTKSHFNNQLACSVITFELSTEYLCVHVSVSSICAKHNPLKLVIHRLGFSAWATRSTLWLHSHRTWIVHNFVYCLLNSSDDFSRTYTKMKSNSQRVNNKQSNDYSCRWLYCSSRIECTGQCHNDMKVDNSLHVFD